MKDNLPLDKPNKFNIMIIQANFNIKEFLEKRGFEDVDKSQECLAVKGDISIYYWSDSRFASTYQLGMVIQYKGETIYKGLVPMNEFLLENLLDLLFPSDKLIREIDNYLLKK